MKKLYDTIIALIIWPLALMAFGISATIYLLFALIIPPKKLHWLVRPICRLILFGSGQILIRHGNIPNPKNGPYLYLFNHQSYLDPFVMGATVKEYVSAVGGDFQFDWPIWGTIVKRYGAIPIIRENLTKAIHSLSLVEKEIKKGVSFIISPEGTRTLTGKMKQFKKGPFHVSLNTGVTIIPVGIQGAFNSYKRFDWRIYPGIVRAYYGEPVYHEQYNDMSIEELRDYIYDKIAVLCDNDSIKELPRDE
jgi:1-acyl-sn-glycerol-3-phosphate acyltransferase